MAPDKPDWTKLDWQPINHAHDSIVAALNDQDGTHWKKASSELNASYLEVPIWILLYEDGSIDQAHAAIRAILAPHREALDPVSCTIAYMILIAGSRPSPAPQSPRTRTASISVTMTPTPTNGGIWLKPILLRTRNSEE